MEGLYVKPKDNYELLGTGIKLNKDCIYVAEPATNLPECDGKIFVSGVLLYKDEYEVIQ